MISNIDDQLPLVSRPFSLSHSSLASRVYFFLERSHDSPCTASRQVNFSISSSASRPLVTFNHTPAVLYKNEHCLLVRYLLLHGHHARYLISVLGFSYSSDATSKLQR